MLNPQREENEHTDTSPGSTCKHHSPTQKFHEKMNSGDIVVAVIDPWSHAKTLLKMLSCPTSLRLFSVVFWLSSTASPTKDLRAAGEEEGHSLTATRLALRW
jgi:hypothetical protein